MKPTINAMVAMAMSDEPTEDGGRSYDVWSVNKITYADVVDDAWYMVWKMEQSKRKDGRREMPPTPSEETRSCVGT